MKKIFIIVMAGLFLGGCNRLDNHQPLSSQKLLFAKANSISQTFLSHRKDLNMVNICARNQNRVLTPMRFELQNQNGEVVRSLDFSAGNIDNEDCTRFQFEPITDSEGQVYKASLSLVLPAQMTLDEEKSLRTGLYVEAHGGGDYQKGIAYLDEQETPYDLHFKTLYRQDLKSIITESLSDFLHRLGQDLVFFLIWLVVLTKLTLLWKRAA